MKAYGLFVILPLVSAIFVFLAVSQSIDAQSFVTDGLVSYWTFDKSEVDDDIVIDIWGENDGTIQGNVELVEGQIEEAISCDGSTGMVEVPINEDLSGEGSDNFTIEAWISVESPCHGVICGRDYWILHWTACGAPPVGMRFYVGVGGWKSITSKTTVKDEWHHWAGVYDGKELKVYADGKLDGSTAMSGEIGGTGDGHASFIVFGKDYHTTVNNDRWNKVMIDEVRIYNRGLTDAEIERNFMVDSNDLAVDVLRKLPAMWGSVKKYY